jgi:uroporphyrinogen-III synthase
VPESPSRTRALDGVRVLVTRPRDQAEGLALRIEQEGGEVVRFPVIEITAPRDTRALHAIIDRLDEFALAIFISPNAVNRALDLIIQRRGKFPGHLSVASVGRGSAKALEHLGIKNVITPADRFDSESLLALPVLQQVTGKRIVIFRGEGGRELLGNILMQRGATVEYAECYQRVRPDTDAAPLLERWARGLIDIVSITSLDGLHNLLNMVGKAGRPWLLRAPVVVISERLAAACRELGFENAPILAREASDEAIVAAIKTWRAAQKTL